MKRSILVPLLGMLLAPYLLFIAAGPALANTFCCPGSALTADKSCPAEDQKTLKCEVKESCGSTLSNCGDTNLPVSGKIKAPAATETPTPAEGTTDLLCCPMGWDCKKTYQCQRQKNCGGDFPQNCSPKPASATASAPAITSIAVPNALGTPYLQVVLGNFAKILVGLTGSIALLIFVYAGITMIMADGNPAQVEKAKKMMIWTVVGLIVIFTAESVLRVIFGALLSGDVS